MVRSLSVAMHGDRRVVLPLLQLKEFDQYTTTHSLNVAVLAMALAETIGCRPADVRAFGVAGLLHDIGKVRIPLEVLTKPGKLTDEEFALMRKHPVDGARIIMQSHDDLELAAVVAYEHHIMLDGGGYPLLRYPRPRRRWRAAWCTSATCSTRSAPTGRTAMRGRRRRRWPTSTSAPAPSSTPTWSAPSARCSARAAPRCACCTTTAWPSPRKSAWSLKPGAWSLAPYVHHGTAGGSVRTTRCSMSTAARRPSSIDASASSCSMLIT